MKHLKVAVSLALISINCLSQSKLDQSKKDLQKNDTPSKATYSTEHRTSSRSYSSSSFNNNDGSLEGIIANAIFTGVVYATFYSSIGNWENEIQLQNNLSTYPYEIPKTGNYLSDESINQGLMRLDIGNKFLFGSHSIIGNHLKAKIRPIKQIYLQSDYYQLEEYDNYSGLAIFTFNLCYDRLRFERFNLGWTMGVNYIASEVKKAGFTYGLNAEWFIFNPLSLHNSMKWSTINHQPVNEFEIQCNYHINKYFISLGYEYLRIGSPHYNFLSVGGGIYL